VEAEGAVSPVHRGEDILTERCPDATHARGPPGD